MGSFKLGGMTLKSLFGKPETVRYPFEVKEPHPGLKGHIVNDIETCILCGICERTCPAGAIAVDKQGSTWAINRFACVQCASCVRACPKDCLSMDPAYQKPTREKTVFMMEKPQESEEEKAAREAAKQAKVTLQSNRNGRGDAVFPEVDATEGGSFGGK